MGGSSQTGTGEQSSSQWQKTKSETMPMMPTELRHLIENTAEGIQNMQSGTNLRAFREPEPREVAPMSEMEQWAMSQVPGLQQVPQSSQLAQQYATQAPGLAGRFVSNKDYYDNFTESPFYQAALNAFTQGAQPLIENQMNLAGLGRSSSLADAMALGWGQQVPQILGQYATQYVEPQLGRETQALQSEAAMTGQMVPQLAALGSQDLERQLQAIQKGMETGGVERGIEQEGFNAAYEDLLRRQSLAEQALYAPMGLLNLIVGARTVQEMYGGGHAATTQHQSGGGK